MRASSSLSAMLLAAVMVFAFVSAVSASDPAFYDITPVWTGTVKVNRATNSSGSGMQVTPHEMVATITVIPGGTVIWSIPDMSWTDDLSGGKTVSGVEQLFPYGHVWPGASSSTASSTTSSGTQYTTCLKTQLGAITAVMSASSTTGYGVFMTWCYSHGQPVTSACPTVTTDAPTVTDPRAGDFCVTATMAPAAFTDVVCLTYCNKVQTLCSSPMYGSGELGFGTCMYTCGTGFSLGGLKTDMQYNTAQCRVNQFLNPLLNFTNGFDQACAQAAAVPPTGGYCQGSPPINCQRYCDTLFDGCPASIPQLNRVTGLTSSNCVAYCGTWATGTTGEMYGNTLSCHTTRAVTAAGTLFAAGTSDPFAAVAGVDGTQAGSGRGWACALAGAASPYCSTAVNFFGYWYPVVGGCSTNAKSDACCCASYGTASNPGDNIIGALPYPVNGPDAFQFRTTVAGGGCYGMPFFGGNFTATSFTSATASLPASYTGLPVDLVLTMTNTADGGQVTLTTNIAPNCPSYFCKDLNANCPKQAELLAAASKNDVWTGDLITQVNAARTGCNSPNSYKLKASVIINGPTLVAAFPKQLNGSATWTQDWMNVTWANTTNRVCFLGQDGYGSSVQYVTAASNVLMADPKTDVLRMKICSPLLTSALPTGQQQSCPSYDSTGSCSTTTNTQCDLLSVSRVSNVPSQWCQTFCNIMNTACPTTFITDAGDGCMAACATWDNKGVMGDTAGNTLQCRLTYATWALTTQTSSYCASAASSSLTCADGYATPTCARYCQQVATACRRQWSWQPVGETMDACVATCMSNFPTAGTQSSTAANTIGCRMYYAGMAYTTPGNDNCKKAQYTSDVCVDPVVQGARDKFLGAYMTVPGVCTSGTTFGTCCCNNGPWNITAVADSSTMIKVKGTLDGGAACDGSTDFEETFNMTSPDTAKFYFSVSGIPITVSLISSSNGGQVTLNTDLLGARCNSYACKSLTSNCPKSGAAGGSTGSTTGGGGGGGGTSGSTSTRRSSSTGGSVSTQASSSAYFCFDCSAAVLRSSSNLAVVLVVTLVSLVATFFFSRD